MNDLVLRLRELRRIRGLSQKEVARRSGIGLKTISSFETGDRIDGMRVSQLRRLLRTYGVSESQFFSPTLDRMMYPSPFIRDSIDEITDELAALQPGVRRVLVDRIRTMIETAAELQFDLSSITPPQFESDYDLIASRN